MFVLSAWRISENEYSRDKQESYGSSEYRLFVHGYDSHINGSVIFLLMSVSETTSSTTLTTPNSPPLSGKSAIAPAAPNEASVVMRRNEPHAAHPIPKIPLPIPPSPAPITLPPSWARLFRTR